jgi:hypothetical protein
MYFVFMENKDKNLWPIMKFKSKIAWLWKINGHIIENLHKAVYSGRSCHHTVDKSRELIKGLGAKP